MADPLTKIPRSAWKHVDLLDDDVEPGCRECELEIAAGWRRPANVILDGDFSKVDVCSLCGRAGYVVAEDAS